MSLRGSETKVGSVGIAGVTRGGSTLTCKEPCKFIVPSDAESDKSKSSALTGVKMSPTNSLAAIVHLPSGSFFLHDTLPLSGIPDNVTDARLPLCKKSFNVDDKFKAKA